MYDFLEPSDSPTLILTACSDVARTQEEQVSSTLATTSRPDATDHGVEFIFDSSCITTLFNQKTYAKFRHTSTQGPPGHVPGFVKAHVRPVVDGYVLEPHSMIQ